MKYDEFVKQFIKWDQSVRKVVTPGLVPYPRFTNSYTVRNSGTVNLYVNGDLIEPDTFKSFGGEPRSVFTGDIDLKWIVQSPAPGTLIEEATITYIFYVNDSI